jgi:hypothetical protein
MNVVLDALPLTDVDLPGTLLPGIEPLNSSYSVAQFYMLNGTFEKTGVLALGSFAAANFTRFQQSLLDGLLELKEKGAESLIVDVTNNGGGYICIAHWLHRIIIGPKRSTEPQAGLDTAMRASPLAQLMAKVISEKGDPDDLLYYNPLQWKNASNMPFELDVNWLEKPVVRKVNGRVVEFSPR